MTTPVPQLANDAPLLQQMVGAPAVRETLRTAVLAARRIARGRGDANPDEGASAMDSAGPAAGAPSAFPPGTESGASGGTGQAGGHDASAMTHAWLFTGPPGAGRSVAARAFAASLVCKAETPGCGKCEACRTALAGTHADIVSIVPDGVVIPVAQVREMIEAASRMPTTADWRVVIVEDADRLNDAGANALLKSVEEPPARTVFLLCAPSTDPDDVQVTIRSRCRHVYVPTPSVSEIKGILADDTRLQLTAKQIDWAASVSGGHVGRAKRLASDEKARAQRQGALKVPEMVYRAGEAYLYTGELVAAARAEAEAATAERDQAELEKLQEALGVGAKGRGAAKAQRGSTGAIRELEAKQKNRRTRMVVDMLDLALMDISGLYRDALMIATGSGLEPLHPDHAGTAAELARRLNAAQLLQCVDAVRMGRELLVQGVRPEGALDAMIGRLRQICVTGPVG